MTYAAVDAPITIDSVRIFTPLSSADQMTDHTRRRGYVHMHVQAHICTHTHTHTHTHRTHTEHTHRTHTEHTHTHPSSSSSSSSPPFLMLLMLCGRGSKLILYICRCSASRASFPAPSALPPLQ